MRGNDIARFNTQSRKRRRTNFTCHDPNRRACQSGRCPQYASTVPLIRIILEVMPSFALFLQIGVKGFPFGGLQRFFRDQPVASCVLTILAEIVNSTANLFRVLAALVKVQSVRNTSRVRFRGVNRSVRIRDIMLPILVHVRLPIQKIRRATGVFSDFSVIRSLFVTVKHAVFCGGVAQSVRATAS